ncbi:MAG: hypothetical protein WCY09_08055 [Candidatus Omnitrophota bacterium]
MIDYIRFIEDRLGIVGKDRQSGPFVLNEIQRKHLRDDFGNREIVLKARQMGFSSLFTAMFTADFILEPNSYSVIVADVEDNAAGLLAKVKYYIQSYEDKTKQKVPLKYNSKNELHNAFMNTTFHIGTAKSVEFGRSRTINNLLFSEFAFFPNIGNMIAGAGQAVTENGKFIIETTANGFNEFKEFWEESKKGLNNHKPLFYKASDFYDKKFLEKKKSELGDKFKQEYPETDIEAFLTSGECYFNKEMLSKYLQTAKNPIKEGLVYAGV